MAIGLKIKILLLCINLIASSAWAAKPCDTLLTGPDVSRRSVIAGLALLPFLPPQASGQEVSRIEGPNGAAFIDQANPEHLIVLEDHRISKLTPHSQAQFSIALADPRCSASAIKDAIYVESYFFGLNSICRIEGDHLNFVSHLQSPPGAFSMTYAGQDDQFIYVLVNGRQFPKGQNGYLHLRAMDRRSQAITEMAVAEDVPDFSGGLWTEGDTIFTVVATGSVMADPSNEIFSVRASDLRDAFRSGRPRNFHQISKKIAGPFSGLSLSLVSGADGFLVDNNEFGKYLIKRESGHKTEVAIPDDCEVVGPWQGQWLALCGSNLRLF